MPNRIRGYEYRELLAMLRFLDDADFDASEATEAEWGEVIDEALAAGYSGRRVSDLSLEEADVYAMRAELAYLERAERAPGETVDVEPVTDEEMRAAYAEEDAARYCPHGNFLGITGGTAFICWQCDDGLPE